MLVSNQTLGSQYTVVADVLGIFKLIRFHFGLHATVLHPLLPQLLLAQSGSSLSIVLRLGLLGAFVFYSTQLFLFISLSLSPFSTTLPPLESAWAYCPARSRGFYSPSSLSFSFLSSAASPVRLLLPRSSLILSFPPFSSSLFRSFCPYGVQLVAYCSARSISTFLYSPSVLPFGPAWAYCPVRPWGSYALLLVEIENYQDHVIVYPLYRLIVFHHASKPRNKMIHHLTSKLALPGTSAYFLSQKPSGWS